LPKIEEALEGQTAGYKVTLDLQPQDAFGDRDENLAQTIPRSEFPPGVKVGGELQWRDHEGRVRPFLVKKIKGQEVFLDGNHPLAGTGLRFVVTVLDVRAASEEKSRTGMCTWTVILTTDSIACDCTMRVAPTIYACETPEETRLPRSPQRTRRNVKISLDLNAKKLKSPGFALIHGWTFFVLLGVLGVLVVSRV
jgi:FKBP-type peptidyl-prolyl cis-trans isomerase 2